MEMVKHEKLTIILEIQLGHGLDSVVVRFKQVGTKTSVALSVVVVFFAVSSHGIGLR